MCRIPELGEVGIEGDHMFGKGVELVGEVLELVMDLFELVEDFAMLLL